MVLPSQGGRPSASRRYMFRRHRLPRGPMLFLVLVIAAVLVSVWFWRQDQVGEADAANPTDDATLRADAGDDDDTGVDDANDSSPPQSPNFGGTFADNRGSEDDEAPGDNLDSEVTTLVMGEPTGDTLSQPPPSSESVTSNEAVSQTPAARPEESAPDVGTDTTPSGSTSSTSSRASREVQIGLDLIASNQPVEARRVLSQALLSGGLSDEESLRVRDELTALNDRLVFSPEIVPGDPFVISYTIEGGDALSLLPRKFGLQVDWRFIQRINRLAKPEHIRQGAQMKLITGPFHAVVSKRDFRLDLYLGDERDRVYVCSLPVGLGEFNGTPEGLFVVRPSSKAVNPAWVNPRTGEQFKPDDAENPIGEHWIGLQGVDEAVKDLTGYGIHGTIEPESIGQERSMGCIRMLPDDVALIYEVLMPHASMIEIRRDV